MAYFQRDSFKMHYEIFPKRASMATLFIHGNLASNRWWMPALEIWKPRPNAKDAAGPLLLGEWRGCGKSSAPRSIDELQMDVLARDYVELLQSLNIAKVNVVAHSTGCLIALFAMLREPERFHRVVFLDPVTAKGLQLGPEMRAAFLQMGRDRAFCQTIMASTIHNVDQTSPLFQGLVDDSFGVAPLIWEGMPVVLSKVDIRNEVRALKHPVLILRGESDPLIPKEDCLELAALLPQAQFQELKGHGHSCNVEDPRLFVELASTFLFE